VNLVSDSLLEPVAQKVLQARPLDFDDGMRLFASRDIHGIGRLADTVRRRLHGRTAWYNVNRHINYTNYCVLRCKFCGFYRAYGSDAPGGYTLSVPQVVEQAGQAYQAGATEVHIVGGLHPDLPFEYYLDMCRSIRAACPRIHIKAFTAIEIIHFSRIRRPRLPIREVLHRLREAGLDSLPGGGAEIFDQRVHDEAYRHKVGPAEWFDVHRAAHELGIFSNATMLFGHIETPQDRIGHLLALRDEQRRSLAECPAHFNCIVPLPFQPAGSELAHLPGPSGLDELKTLAICRLVLDNVPHVKAFWVMLSPKLAQVSLNWGVDDLDGTVEQYQIVGSGQPDHARLSVRQLQRMIVEAGFEPIERDSLYRPVVRDGPGPGWRLAEAAP
jgi:aminodeoxyfutalosine synthase